MSEELEVEDAVELFREDGSRVVISLWRDGYLTVCTSKAKGEDGYCYTTSKANKEVNRELFYILQAFYSEALGMKVKGLK